MGACGLGAGVEGFGGFGWVWGGLGGGLGGLGGFGGGGWGFGEFRAPGGSALLLARARFVRAWGGFRAKTHPFGVGV